MKKYEIGALVLAGAVGTATAALASQPPDVVNSDSNGNTAMGRSSLFSLTTGIFNTAAGAQTLCSNSNGSTNTAVGGESLCLNQNGGANSAVGYASLSSNISGIWNSAMGLGALSSNITGSYNTATGVLALYGETSGLFDTAEGVSALNSTIDGAAPSTGQYDTASGYEALYANTSGSGNTAVGAYALMSSTNVYNNSAFGCTALTNDTSGDQNAGFGAFALTTNTVGSSNVAVGYQSMYFNTKGTNNVAVGLNAGYNLTSGSNNIDISNEGLAGDDDTIKIGAANAQTKTYIAGIENSKVTGAAVYVTASGQLGVLASSARYKTAIAPMATRTHDLDRLRPVTFHLRNDPHGAVQNGLIAEEVATIYPELVIRDAAGRIQGVRYDELTPMLLNEVQQQNAQLEAMEQQVADLTQTLQTVTRQERDGAPRVAMR
jgi:hypothetical protein